jgi:hypothetical protein
VTQLLIRRFRKDLVFQIQKSKQEIVYLAVSSRLKLNTNLSKSSVYGGSFSREIKFNYFWQPDDFPNPTTVDPYHLFGAGFTSVSEGLSRNTPLQKLSKWCLD